MRPLIGIGTAREDGRDAQRRDYADAVASAGGAPVLLPGVDEAGAIETIAERLDGLIIPGGPGIVAGVSAALPGDLEPTPRERARFDEALARSFLRSGKPILGICYGMQLLNVLEGGTLYADVMEEVEGTFAHSQKRGAERHDIRLEPGSALEALFGRQTLTVNSRHIQAVRDVAPGFRVSARAPDGVIEAIETEGARVIGVQFHPERLGPECQPLFRHLTTLAARARESSPHPDGASRRETLG